MAQGRSRLAVFAGKATMAALLCGAMVAAGCQSVPNPIRRPATAGAAPQSVIGVNAYLWRASLDTLSFMPLASADPFGGIITTDWYSAPEAPNERFKATVYILDTRLRADGLNVAINRQTLNGSNWTEAEVAPETEDQIENAILIRARQIRVTGR